MKTNMNQQVASLMRGRLALVAIVAWAAVMSLAGCSFSSLTTASNLPEGEGQFFVAPGYNRYQRSQGEPLWAPQLEVGGRYAITDRVEVGGKVWLPGAQVDVKVAMLGQEERGRGFNLSLDPSLGYLGGFEGNPEGGDTLHIVTVGLPVLMGWEFGESELVFGPRLIDQVWTGTGDTLTANIVAVGASLGFAWYVGRGVTVLPEVSWGTIVAQSLEDFGSNFGRGGTLVQGTLGFVFGGHGGPECPCPCPAP